MLKPRPWLPRSSVISSCSHSSSAPLVCGKHLVSEVQKGCLMQCSLAGSERVNVYMKRYTRKLDMKCKKSNVS